MGKIWLALLVFLFILGGCSEHHWLDEIGDASSPDDTGEDSDSDSNSEGDGPECDEKSISINQTLVKLMILAEASNKLSEVNPKPWMRTKTALNNTLGTWTNSGIEFGFDHFPNTNNNSIIVGTNCDVAQPVDADVSIGNQQAIAQKLDGIAPHGQNALLCAMANFLNPFYAPNFLDSTEERYLLIISTGLDTCGWNCLYDFIPVDPALLMQTTLSLKLAGIKTFAIGFGDNLGTDQLDAIVQAGDTVHRAFPRPTTAFELETEITDFARSIVSCRFDLDDADAGTSRDKVNLLFVDDDGTQTNIGLDVDCGDNKGWRWVGNHEVELCEEACTTLRDKNPPKIKATWGCPTEVVAVL